MNLKDMNLKNIPPHPFVIKFASKYKLEKHIQEIEWFFSPFFVIRELSDEDVQNILKLLEPFDPLLPENIISLVHESPLNKILNLHRKIEWPASPREILFRKLYNLSVVWLDFELSDKKDPVEKKLFAELEELCQAQAVPFIRVYIAITNSYRNDFFTLLSEHDQKLTGEQIFEIMHEYTNLKLTLSPEFKFTWRSQQSEGLSEGL
jgi:hypothetical protein